ncbi:MAG TPA: hypothetical protein VF770_06935, partial [Solirubrobacterales bacterium]
MRTRLVALLPATVLLLALPASAQASSESFPNKAGNYVSDHIAYFVGGLAVAILLLLLVISITHRRGKEKAKKQAAAGTTAPPVAPSPPPGGPPANSKER